MRIKPDRYFNNGIFEMAQIGNNVYLKNIVPQAQHTKAMASVAEKCPELKTQIDSLVLEIKEAVLLCEPLKLLQFLQFQFLQSMIGVTSESQQIGLEYLSCQRSVEYIQSIYVSCKAEKPIIEDTDNSVLYNQISAKIDELFSLVHQYYMALGIKYKLEEKIDDALLNELIQAQFMYGVRGNRYQFLEKDYYSYLLSSHDSIFQQLFGIGAENVVDGISKIQYALSQGKFAPFNRLMQMFNELQDTDPENIEKEMESHREERKKLASQFFGYELNDICKITGWPQTFAKSLSFSLGEDTSFFSHAEYPGWPIIDLPIHKRPFIEIDGCYYCFDYFSFVDHFYRAIQKMISREAKEYDWNKNQQKASENMVADLFRKILPGCTVYENNYYPHTTSLKQMNENDLLIQYYDTLFIIEVKAGSFVYTAPLTDFEQHIKSYKKLIEEPDTQCERTFGYLKSYTSAKLYNIDKTEKATIDMGAVEDIYMFSITVDNINVFASKAEKISFLKHGNSTISIAVDDLMVYQNYFGSPLKFLHFLSQRKAATINPRIAPDDELDHLGMYIAHNCYSLYFGKDKNVKLNLVGYREDLDTYFSQLYHPDLSPTKPQQRIPEFIDKIIAFLDSCDLQNKVRISNYLLNFSTDAREQLEDIINGTLVRQKEIGHSIAYSTAGNTEDSLRYTLFIEQPGIKNSPYDERVEYALSTMLWNTEKNRTLICIRVDKDNAILGIDYEVFYDERILEEKRKKLFLIGADRAKQRVEKYCQQYGKKIGRNQICPCGSGKKYKHCCEGKYSK